jgi:glutathione peroxidase
MSIYDISLKSWDDKENILSSYKGKVTLITNVTGDCGNAPQFSVIETLYKKYKNDGFEVLAIPTNDYCGANLTYGEHVHGTEDASGAKAFAENLYNVTYNFSELVSSNPTPEEVIPGLASKYGQNPVHEVYQEIFNQMAESEYSNKKYMFGNFEKFLFDKNGKLIKHYSNGSFLNQNYENYLMGLSDKPNADRADKEYMQICSDIEMALAS